MKKRLFLFTAEFPYGIHETFIENEWPVAIGFYDEIILCPYKKNSEQIRDVPSNISVCNLPIEKNSNWILFRNLSTVFVILWVEFRKTKSRKFFIRNIRKWISLIKSALMRAEALEKKLKEYPADQQDYYSFWMNDWALTLAILQHKKKINSFFFRCGGFDIWNERHPGNYLPFRYFIYSKTSGIYPNSQQGEKYLKQLGFFPDKIKCYYWGTPDRGLSRAGDAPEKLVVSCSSLIPLKRVELLVQSLCLCKTPVRWVHFGDGPQREQVVAALEKAGNHIQYTLMGNVPNTEVHRFYHDNPVDLFITTSETESLPVSIQEALSYGIPIVATNVGGIAEMVDETSGLLINREFEPKTLAKLIDEWDLDHWRNANRRAKIKDAWKEKFEDKNVYSRFYTDRRND